MKADERIHPPRVAHRPNAGAVRAARGFAFNFDRAAGVPPGAQAAPLFQKGGQGDGFESRPGVAAALHRQVELLFGERQAGGHGQHRPGVVFDHGDGPGGGPARVRKVGSGHRQPGAEDVVGLFLQFQIHGYENFQAAAAFAFRIMGGAAENSLLALDVVFAQKGEFGVVQQLAPHFGHHMVGRALESRRFFNDKRRFFGCGGGLEVHETGGGHGVDDVVPPFAGALRLAAWVVQAGVADGDHQGGGFGRGQVAHVFPEIFPGGGRHAVGRPAEIHRIQVELQDLLLVVHPFQFYGVQGFGDFALDGQVGAHDVAFHHLLGDGGTPPLGSPGHVVAHGADDGGEIDALMFEKVPVFGG